jgi:hypothetical protein
VGQDGEEVGHGPGNGPLLIGVVDAVEGGQVLGAGLELQHLPCTTRAWAACKISERVCARVQVWVCMLRVCTLRACTLYSATCTPTATNL